MKSEKEEYAPPLLADIAPRTSETTGWTDAEVTAHQRIVRAVQARMAMSQAAEFHRVATAAIADATARAAATEMQLDLAKRAYEEACELAGITPQPTIDSGASGFAPSGAPREAPSASEPSREGE